MSTKNNPGTIDCYARAEPNEPMFVLLGRDPCAGPTIFVWRLLRHALGEDLWSDQLTEADHTADMAGLWASEHGKAAACRAAYDALSRVLEVVKPSSTPDKEK